MGLVVALPRGNPLVCFPLVEYTPNVNDLADLLADAMRRLMLVAGRYRMLRRELGWSPRYAELKPIIETAWNWHRRHPKGYDD